MTTGDPASHLDPEYLHFDKFKEAYEAGYDGVKVPDLLQSERWGNFGHDSYGVFPDSIKKLRYDSVPATNYDPETVEGWSLPTPEFVLWVKENYK